MVNSLLSPLVLAANLVLLLGSEVILNIKCLPDLFRGFAFDHVGHSLATDIEKSLDIKVIGSLKVVLVKPKADSTIITNAYKDDLK